LFRLSTLKFLLSNGMGKTFREAKNELHLFVYRGRNNGQQNLLLFVAILSTTNLRIIFLRKILGVIFETRKIPEIFPTCVTLCTDEKTKRNNKVSMATIYPVDSYTILPPFIKAFQ
jgi:hypothetical protein